MKRKIPALILVFVLILSVFSCTGSLVVSAYDFSGDYEYLLRDGKITLIKYWGDDSRIVIPDSIKGYPVTEIGSNCFDGKYIKGDYSKLKKYIYMRNISKITNITVPATVKVIRYGAFSNMENLSEIILNEGLETIEDNAFSFCKKLKKINLPESLIYFHLTALDGTGVEEITFSENTYDYFLQGYMDSSVKTVTFNSKDTYLRVGTNTAIETVIINGNLNEIEIKDRNSHLKQIICNGEVSYTALIDAYALGFELYSDESHKNIFVSKSNTDNRKIYESEGFRYYINGNSEAVIKRYIGTESNVVVPSSIDGYTVTELAPAAFSSMAEDGYFNSVNGDGYIGINQLVSVTLPDTIKKIGSYAFSRNLSLEMINIPKGIGGIPRECFYDCESLKSIYLPESVTEISEKAFHRCIELENVDMPGVEKIGSCAFGYCLKLSSVTSTENIRQIGSEAFLNCNLSGFISLPLLTEIRYGAFCQCENLESVYMPNVEKIESNAFRDCSNLSSITCFEKLREIGSGAFCQCGLTGTLDLSSVTKIGLFAFVSNNITRVILNDNLETIEYATFEECKYLEEVNFPSKLVSIGSYAFYGSKIHKAVFNDGLKVISPYAFNCCPELTIIELPESIEEIGTFAFEKAPIETLVIPKNLKLLGNCAFANCKNLQILYFNAVDCKIQSNPQVQTEIDTENINKASPFQGCDIKEIHLGEGVMSIGGNNGEYGTFEGCTGLESVVIPDTVSKIGTATFKNCTSLETAVVPGSVTSISDNAFEGCDKLTIICFSDSYVYSYAKSKGIKVSTFVVSSVPNQIYTGFEIKPEVNVKFSGNQLYKNIDFGVTYANNINAGEADIIVRGKGDYKNFSNKTKFTIVPKNIALADVSSVADQPYTGSAVTPELIITDGTKFLVAGKDYSTSFSDNKKVGTARVQITGIGNYKGNMSVQFQIVKMSGSQSFFTDLMYRMEMFFAKIVSLLNSAFRNMIV